MRSECYVLDIYCDTCDGEEWRRSTHQFTGQNKREAHKKAHERGWKIGERDLCPECKTKRGAS